MTTPTVPHAEALATWLWGGGTTCPRRGYRSKLVSQGLRDIEPLRQSEDRIQGVLLQVRLNTSHLVFQSPSLIRVHRVWAIGMWEINKLGSLRILST